MSAHERDFSNFYLGDNVYELADGLIPEIADRLEIEAGAAPSSQALQAVMNQVGKNRVLRENADITAFDKEEMADLVDRSGVQRQLRRSLWSPEHDLTADSPADAAIIMSGVANWQDRTANLAGTLPAEVVYSLAGSRTMNSDSEQSNPNIKKLFEKFGRYPTESEYAASIVVPRLVSVELDVLATAYDTKDGDTIFAKFFEQNPGLLDKRLVMARVANAGIIMAIQMRDAARRSNPDFDSAPDDPQVFVATDSFPVARTEAEDNDPANFQKAATALRQVVLTAKKLHEASTAGN